MKKGIKLTELIQHPQLLNKDTLYQLRTITAQYPYFQVARLLMLQNLFLLHDSSFDEELRHAAIYITDRSTLFKLIEEAHHTILDYKNDNEKIVLEKQEDRTASLIDTFLESLPQENAPKNKNKRKPTPTDATIDYVSYLMEVQESENDSSTEDISQSTEQGLIDTFLDQNKGQIQLKEEKQTKLYTDERNKDDAENNEEYFTETLARIYIKQGRYEKALKIIKQISAIYPKKNAYFADQIRFIEKLIAINKEK